MDYFCIIHWYFHSNSFIDPHGSHKLNNNFKISEMCEKHPEKR